MNEALNIASLVLVMMTTLTILWGPRWRWIIVALALQYAAVFILISQIWPLSLAAVTLISGWMAGAVLGASQHESDADRQRHPVAGRLFRVFGGFVVFTIVISLTQAPGDWLPIEKIHLASGLILAGMGLFQLGLASRPLAVIIGLLTTLSGFMVIYASLVTSVLVTGLLTVVTLGLALAGAYWMVPLSEEEGL